MFNYGLENINSVNYATTKLHDIVQIIALFSAFVCLLLKKMNLNKFIRIILVFTLGLLCYYFGRWTNILISILAIYLIDKINIDQLLKFIFVERLLIFLIIISLSCLGILENTIAEVAKHNYISSSMTLGYNHPNALASTAGMLILLYLCINRESITSIKRLVLIFFNIIVFIVSGSRTTLLLVFFAIILEYVINKHRFIKLITKTIPYLYFLLIGLMAIAIVMFLKVGYTNELLNFINDNLFNGRLGLSALYLSTYPLSLFGNNLDITLVSGNAYYALDNGYIIQLMYNGIVGFIFLMWIFLKLIFSLRKTDELFLCVLITIFAIWVIYEGVMISLSGNFILLFYSQYCIDKYKIEVS